MVRRRPSSRSTRGAHPVSSRSREASTHWRSISPSGVPAAAHVGLQVGTPACGADRAHDVDRAVRGATAGVQRRAAGGRFRPCVEQVEDRQVRLDGIIDEEEVALRRAVRAHDGRAAREDRGDRLGDEPRGVLVAAAVDVRQARDGDTEPVGAGVGARDQVRGGLRGVVGVRGAQWHVLGVRQDVARAVGLVGRGDDRARNVVHAARLEDVPGAAHVGLERRPRGAVGRAHDGLRRQMQDRVDLVLAHGALEQVGVEQVPAHDRAARLGALERQCAAGPFVAAQHDHGGAAVQERAGEPRSEHPVGARHERAPPGQRGPERRAHQRRHGASPRS